MVRSFRGQFGRLTVAFTIELYGFFVLINVVLTLDLFEAKDDLTMTNEIAVKHGAFSYCSNVLLKAREASLVVWTIQGKTLKPFCDLDGLNARELSLFEPRIQEYLLTRRGVEDSPNLELIPRLLLSKHGCKLKQCILLPIAADFLTAGLLGVFYSGSKDGSLSSKLLNEMSQRCLTCISTMVMATSFRPETAFPIESSLQTLDRRRALPKGIHESTLELVWTTMRRQGRATASDVAVSFSLSAVTTRKYLYFLAKHGLLRVNWAYGSAGRPPATFELSPLGTELKDLGSYSFEW